MNDFAKKMGADSEDPWEDLAEQLFGTTPGKEHSAVPAQASGTQSGGQPLNPLEAILSGVKPAPSADQPKKKSLSDLLFDEPDSPVFEEEDAPPVSSRGKRAKVEPEADLGSDEPERGDLVSPQPKPATGSSPQDSYWDALANWSWDDGSSSQSQSAAGRVVDESASSEPEPVSRSDSVGRQQSGGRPGGGKPQTGRGGDRGGARGGRGRRDDRGGRSDRPREQPASAEEPHQAASSAEKREHVPTPRNVVADDSAPIWDFEAESETAAPSPTRGAKPARPTPAVPAKGVEPAADEDEEVDDSEPKRRRRRRGRPEDEVTTPTEGRPKSAPPSSTGSRKVEVPGADWDESDEELPDTPAQVSRPVEPARSDERREERPRREGGRSLPADRRPPTGRRDSGRTDDRSGPPRRSESAASEPARDVTRSDRGARRGARDESRVESDDRPVRGVADVDSEVEEAGEEAGGRGERSNRRDRGRRRNTSRPEDWSEADFESIEDRVGFDAEDADEDAAGDEDEGAELIVNFDEVPSWEEAISYLLKAEPSDGGFQRGGPPRSSRGGSGGGGRRRR